MESDRVNVPGKIQLQVDPPSADFAVERVADWARLGGHAVPEETVRRRWRMYDNSVQEPLLIASGAETETLAVNDGDLWRRIRAEASHEG
jgi:predicted ABC-type ATPase